MPIQQHACPCAQRHYIHAFRIRNNGSAPWFYWHTKASRSASWPTTDRDAPTLRRSERRNWPLQQEIDTLLWIVNKSPRGNATTPWHTVTIQEAAANQIGKECLHGHFAQLSERFRSFRYTTIYKRRNIRKGNKLAEAARVSGLVILLPPAALRIADVPSCRTCMALCCGM